MGKKLHRAADPMRHLSSPTQIPHSKGSQVVSPVKEASSLPGPFCPLLSRFLLFFSSPSSFHFLLPSHLPAGFAELMKLWIPSSSFSHSISVIACTGVEIAGSPHLKMKRRKKKKNENRSKIESKCFENWRHSEATLQPLQRKMPNWPCQLLPCPLPGGGRRAGRHSCTS